MQNEGNQYEGLVDAWKVQLIAARARRKGFDADKIQDAQQEIILDVIAFEYDPANPAGASEETILRRLIDGKLCNMLRSEMRRKKHESLYADMKSSGHFKDSEEQPITSDQSDLPLIAFDDILKSLDDVTAEACRMITHGYSRREIAESLGVCERTVRNMIVRIREHLERAGYQGWGVEK